MKSEAEETSGSRVDEPIRWPLLTGGILITMASAIAYTAVYSYDLGFCSYFFIPVSVISISVTNLVAVGLFVLALMYYALFFGGILLTRRRLAGLSGRWYVIPLYTMVVVCTAFLWLFLNWSLLVKVIFILAVTAAAILAAKLTLRLFRRAGHPAPMPTTFLSAFMSPQAAVNVLGIILAVLAVVFGSSVMGRLTAELGVYYPVTDEAKPKVILAFYGDTAVAAEYDGRTKTVTPRFTLYKVGQTLPPFTEKKLGRLKVAQP